MKKRELSKILNLVLNEELNLAHENVLRVLKEETEKKKEKAISKLEADKDTIAADETYNMNITEKEVDVDSLANQQAASEVEDGTLDFSDPTVAANVDISNVDPNEVNYSLNDVRIDMDDLKKKFDEIVSKISSDIDSESEEGATDPEESKEESVSDEPKDSVSEETLEKNLTDEDKDGNLAESTKDYTLENILSEDIFSSIMEEYEGTKVNMPDNKDGEVVGNGESISQNDKSPLSSENKTFDDLETEATPIEVINSDSPNGFEKEKSPEVHGNGIDPENKPDIKEVPANGDKDAIINSNDGFGGKDSKSPIPGN